MQSRKQNIITNTDSYKFLNNSMFEGVTNIYSYFESRNGSQYPTTKFFGLQYLLKTYLDDVTITQEMIDEAKVLANNHLGSSDSFNLEMWEHIKDNYNGKLPIEIKAVPEGLEVPESNVLMTITLTQDDAKCVGLVNHLETLLTNVWSACTVATKSTYIKNLLIKYAEQTCEEKSHIPFQLHDFAQRSAKSPEVAGYNGAGHLINFFGTDTVLAWENLRDYYSGNIADIGYSVFATEHNYMMYKGVDGEEEVLGEILAKRPNGIISVVSDTYNIYNFVDNLVGNVYKENIKNREGVFVVRPDSLTPDHGTPEDITLWILESLWKNFGGTTNEKGCKVLDPHVRVIYGDGLDEESIENILILTFKKGFSSENIVFGCGSYLIDKHNRDTQRFAYKSSAIKINGNWEGRFKKPLGSNKVSKKGRLKLVKTVGSYITLTETDEGYAEAKDELVTVYKDGKIVKEYSLEEVRKNSNF